MTAEDLGLPGQRERPPGWTPLPTTEGRSWAELVETVQGGLAVIDDDCRLVYVSDRFLPLLGQPDVLVGRDLRHLLPALSDDDPRALRHQFTRGDRIDFEQQVVSRDGDWCWYHVTVVPCDGLGDGLIAVAFATDITATSRTLAHLRDATVGLTEVESELHRRVGRGVHDGPIQLLAALMFRLGMSDTDDANELQQVVSEVAGTLRHVVEEFSPVRQRAEGTLLEQWTAPFLVDSEISVNVDDRRVEEPGLAEVQAAFVLVYHVVRAAKDHKIRRTLDVLLTDEHGGQRIVVTIPSSESPVLAGRRAAQERALAHHARALGGTLSVWLADTGLRTASMWIPKLAEAIEPPLQTKTRSRHSARERTAHTVPHLPRLRDSAWQTIVDGAPERIIEWDDQARISFANTAQRELVGVAPGELVGMHIASIFVDDSLSQLHDVFDRLDAGEFVEVDWTRENWLGDSRLIHMTISPRLDQAGAWQGALVVADDRTDVELLDDLYQTALADLTVARRRAIEASIQRLEEPLAKCDQLIGQIEAFDRATSQPSPIHNITVELAASLRKIRDSTSVLGSPRLSKGDLDTELRESLGTLLVGRRLVVVDNTEAPPPAEVSDVIYRIAREAVNNAVLHGKAGYVAVTLANANDGFSCEIHDKGIGINPDRLHHRAGHLGVRAMQERARERGGTCHIAPDPRGGTLVSVWLPDHTDRPSLLHSSLTAFL